MTGTGVCITFIFPFDSQLPRKACVVWRRTVGGQRNVDTKYAEVTQSGDSAVVHEQITFPGDCWAVVAEDVTLAQHFATAEREQRVTITRASRAAASQPPAAPAISAGGNDSDPELAAAICASLQCAVDEAGVSQLHYSELQDALALSKRLADKHRQHEAAAHRMLPASGVAMEGSTAGSQPTDADAMRSARLRRFEGKG